MTSRKTKKVPLFKQVPLNTAYAPYLENIKLIAAQGMAAAEEPETTLIQQDLDNLVKHSTAVLDIIEQYNAIGTTALQKDRIETLNPLGLAHFSTALMAAFALGSLCFVNVTQTKQEKKVRTKHSTAGREKIARARGYTRTEEIVGRHFKIACTKRRKQCSSKGTLNTTNILNLIKDPVNKELKAEHIKELGDSALRTRIKKSIARHEFTQQP
jgi:hypothetical protein